jgi:hypothetical protein
MTPTTKNQIEDIRKAVILAVPENEKQQDKLFDLWDKISEAGDRNVWANLEKKDWYFARELFDTKIRLADILVTLGKNKVDVGCLVSFKGSYCHLFPQGDSKKEEPIPNTNVSVDTRKAQYNLLADDITLQSPETISFIHNLLYGK